MNPILRLIICVLTVSACVTHAADVVRLKNGDRISGDVTRMEDGSLKVDTQYAGKIVIQWSEVEQLLMDEPVEVLLEDDTVTETAQFSRRQDDDDAKNPTAGVDPAEAKIINPNAVDLGKKGKFTGRVNLSGKFESGNTNKDEIDADYTLSYRRNQHRFRSQGQLEYDHDNDVNSKRDWLWLNSYDYFLSEQSYLSLRVGLKQEYFEGLDLRTLVGPSYGHQFYDGKPTSLLSELGVYFVKEEFIELPDNEFVGPGWIVDFEHQLSRTNLRLYHKNYAILSGDDTSKFLWHSWTGVSLPLFKHLVGSLEFEADYDSEPALREHELDKTVRLKLGYEW